MKKWFILGFCACVLMVLYPLVSNYLYSRRQDRIITEYSETVKEMGTAALQEELEACREYNRSIVQTSAVVTRGQSEDVQFTVESPVDSAAYEARLNPDGSGVMGYVIIPKIDVCLPVSHYATAKVLDSGVGHLPESSLPVGGEGCHAVLTGHTGSTGKAIFTDLENMAVGDRFFLSVLEQVLVYEVDQILTVLPYEVEELMIVEGQDLCTLVTCTPYGINSHRLLVRGRRVEETEGMPVGSPADDGQETVPDMFAGTEDTYDFSRFKAYYFRSVAIGGIAACVIIFAFLTVGIVRKRHF